MSVIEDFNRIIKILALKCGELYPDDTYTLNQRVFTALSIDETSAIESLGPVLWKHRTRLLSDDAEFFKTYNFLNDIPLEDRLLYGKDLSKLLKNLRRDFATIPESETLVRMMKQLLFLYTNYIKK
jgi:hypothetical protein